MLFKHIPFVALILCLLIANSFHSLCQEIKIKYQDYAYRPNIETVLFYKTGTINSHPMIQLHNPGESLTLSFDCIGGEQEEFQYTIIHCDADWQPSPLFQNEYIEGLTYESVENFNLSFNTFIKYTNYWLYLPTENMRPKISGNYILKVYKIGNEDDILITRRFYVYDQKVVIDAKVKQPTYAKYRDFKQEIDFEINYQSLPVMNPIDELKVVIRQNQRWDNQISGLKPQYIRENNLIFDYEEETLFDACSEFRFADVRAIKFAGRNVNKVFLDSLYNQVLYVDEDRSYKTYSVWGDINGNRIIQGESSDIPIYELDYQFVHFFLSTPYPKDEDIYLFGAFTDWQIHEKYKLEFNPRSKLYEITAFLKQGFYNFQYVLAKDGEIDCARFEGSHFETENDYLILVYYKSQFLRTDELVGINILNTKVK